MGKPKKPKPKKPDESLTEQLANLPENISNAISEGVTKAVTALQAELISKLPTAVAQTVGFAVQGAVAEAMMKVTKFVGEKALSPETKMPGLTSAAKLAEAIANMEAYNRVMRTANETTAQTGLRLMELQKGMIKYGATFAKFVDREKIYGRILDGNLKGQAQHITSLQRTTQAIVALKTPQEDAIDLQNRLMRQHGMSAPEAIKFAARLTVVNKELKFMPGHLTKIILAAKDTWATLGDTAVVEKQAIAIAKWARDTGRSVEEVNTMVEKYATFPRAVESLQRLAPIITMGGGQLGDIRKYIGQRPETFLKAFGGAVKSMRHLQPRGEGQPVPAGMSPEVFSLFMRAGGAASGMPAGGFQAMLQRPIGMEPTPVIGRDPQAALMARARKAVTPMEVYGSMLEALLFVRDTGILKGAKTDVASLATMLKGFSAKGGDAVATAGDLGVAFSKLKLAIDPLTNTIAGINEHVANHPELVGQEKKKVKPGEVEVE